MQSKDFGGRLTGVFGDLLVRRFLVRQPEMYRVVEAVSSQRLTSMDKAALCELAQTAMDIEFDGLDGDFLQAGCGGAVGAAIVIAHAKRRSRNFLVHDPFDGPDAEIRVRRELAAHGTDERLNVQLVPGSYEETLTKNGSLALVHVNCGEYAPMRILLERLAPRLVPGAHLIVDDYKTKKECRQAVDDYFHGKGGFRLVRQSRLHVIRN